MLASPSEDEDEDEDGGGDGGGGEGEGEYSDEGEGEGDGDECCYEGMSIEELQALASTLDLDPEHGLSGGGSVDGSVASWGRYQSNVGRCGAPLSICGLPLGGEEWVRFLNSILVI